MYLMLALVQQEPTSQWELQHSVSKTITKHLEIRGTYQSGIDSSPSKQNTKVQSNARMQSKENRSTGFDDIMQRPSISPAEECRFDIDIVESS
jgi:hypothetical protein